VGFRSVAGQRASALHDSEAESAEALQQKQDLLTQAEKMGRVGGWEFDIETKQQTWTDMVYEIHELDTANLPTVDQGINYYTPASRPVIERAVQRAIEQGEPFDVELEIITAKGNLRSVHAIGKADPARRKISGFFQDITERKRNEKLMSLQSEVLKVLTADITVEQTTAEVVAVVKQAVGFDAVGLRLRTGSDYPFVSSLGYSEEFLKAENTLTHSYPTGGLCRNDDGTISLECTCGLIISGKTDPANQLFTPGGSAWTNNSLPFLDVPPDADPRLHPRNRCIHVGFLSLALIPVRAGGEVIGLLHLADSHPDRFTPEAIRLFEGIGISIGVALSRKQAEQTLVQSRRAALNMMTDAVEARDQSEQMSKELKKHRDHLEQLVSERTTDLKSQSVVLEASNRELESFAYSVSHDLRAPLRTIDGFSQIIIDDYAGKLDEQGRNYLLRVKSATQKMGQLIDDMLKLSRITRQELKREHVDLSMMARKISAELSKNQPERQVEFVIKPGCMGECDRQLIGIALENLIGNSWKYSSRHTSARIEFGTTEKDGKTVYFVRDDGAGFDPAYADKLFAPFQRLHSATEFEGNGIGLATIQRIARKHGGSVWAEGQVEKGATFYFTLK
jgi:signal transduction histidine kinase